MKHKLLPLLTIITLCTSCSYEPLFFTDSPATEDEVRSLLENVSGTNAIIPNGWYKYERTYTSGNEECSNTILTFYVETEVSTASNRTIFNFKKLKGETHYSNGKSYNYLGDENSIFISIIERNGQKKTLGSTSKKFRLDSYLLSSFHDLNKYNQNIYYIKNNKFHYNGTINNEVTDLILDIGIEYSNNYQSIKIGKSHYKNYFKDLDNYCIDQKSMIQPCNPIEVTVSQEYENEVPYRDTFRIPEIQ